MYKLNKGSVHQIENVGDLKKALEKVPDYLRIEISLSNSFSDNLYAGVFTNEDDPEDQYFCIEEE